LQKFSQKIVIFLSIVSNRIWIIHTVSTKRTIYNSKLKILSHYNKNALRILLIFCYGNWKNIFVIQAFIIEFYCVGVAVTFLVISNWIFDGFLGMNCVGFCEDFGNIFWLNSLNSNFWMIFAKIQHILGR
jgi:hypothetical protein